MTTPYLSSDHYKPIIVKAIETEGDKININIYS